MASGKCALVGVVVLRAAAARFYYAAIHREAKNFIFVVFFVTSVPSYGAIILGTHYAHPCTSKGHQLVGPTTPKKPRYLI